MKIKYLVFFFVNICITVGLTFGIIEYKQTKLAYVQTEYLIYNYAGMIEAMEEFDRKKVQWHANIDTLKLNYEKEVNHYQQVRDELSSQKREQWENRLAYSETQWKQYTAAISKKMGDENDNLMEGIANQINSLVKAYGDKNGYDIILGTAQSGNIMYAGQGFDITNELLEALNKNYIGDGK